MEPELIRDAAIALILGGGLLVSGVPLRWVVGILIVVIAMTYGIDALFDEFSSEG